MKGVLATGLAVWTACWVGGTTVRAGTRCPAYRVNQPIHIDGVMDEEAWLHLPTVTGFIHARQPDLYSALQTAFQAGYDDQALYIGIRADEPQVEACLAWAKDRSGQGIEVLLDPPVEGVRQPYQFAVGMLGDKRYEFKADLAGNPFKLKETEWRERDTGWAWALKPGRDSYTLEMAFPFKGLGTPTPANGDEWGMQIGRFGTSWPRAPVLEGLDWKLAQWTAWAPMPSGFWRNAGEHGTLEFVDEVLLADAQNVGRKTEELNAAFYEWRATRGEAMQRVEKLLARTEGKTDLLRAGDDRGQPKIRAFGHGRNPTPDDPPAQWNKNWWTNNDGNPRTIVCSWDKPVTVNMQHIDWLGPASYATQYSLEYRTDDGWQLAYAEENNALPVSCHLFAAVTTDKLRFTITGMETGSSYYLAIQKYRFFHVDADEQGDEK